MTLSQLLKQIVTDRHGFLTKADLVELAKLDRLHPVLVRCACGRFSCPAQDATHFIGLVDRVPTEGSRRLVPGARRTRP